MKLFGQTVAILMLPGLLTQPTMAQSLPPSQAPLTTVSTEEPYDFYMRQGYAAAKEKDYESAARYFRNALYDTPGDRDALTAYWNMRDALRPQDESSSDDELTDYDRYMEIGYDATETGDYQTALINFQRALSEKPNDYYATQAARNVKTYINRGQTSTVTAAAKIYPNELPYDRYMRLGYAAMQRDDYQTAIQQFRNALVIRPDDRQASIAFWNVSDVLSQGPRESLSTRPEPAYDRWMRRGYDATDEKAYRKALTYFQNALKERPGDYYATQAIRNLSTYVPTANR